MVSTSAVAIAASLQMVLGIAFFIEQSPDLCSTAPTLASYLFLIGFLDILLDMRIFPIRYMHLPYVCQLMAETVLAVLLTEFSCLIVWCTIERICCKLCKLMVVVAGMPPNIYYAWEGYILGTATTAISLAFLLCAGYATDHFHILRKKSLRTYRNVNHYVGQLWQKCRQMISSKKEGDSSSPSLLYRYQLPEDDETFEQLCEQLYRPRKYEARGRSRSRSRTRRRR